MKTRIALIVLMVLIGGMACKFSGEVMQQLELLATNTPPATETPLPSPTSIPTNTPQPTPTVPPSPVPPTPAPPTDTLEPSPVPPTETAAPTVTYLHVTNHLGKAAKYFLQGPETRSFTVNALSTYDTEIEPGTYRYTITISGFNTLTGTITFGPGDFSWSLGREK